MRQKWAVGDIATLKRSLTTFAGQTMKAGEILIVHSVERFAIGLHSADDEDRKIEKVLREYLVHLGGPNDVRPEPGVRTACLKEASLAMSCPSDWLDIETAAARMGITRQELLTRCRKSKRSRMLIRLTHPDENER